MENNDINVEDIEISTSSIDSNDSEYGYGTMLDQIDQLINIEDENKLYEIDKVKNDYVVLYRGINFSNYSFNDYEYKGENPKLKDKKHKNRRLFIKNTLNNTINQINGNQTNYHSMALDKYLLENQNLSYVININSFCINFHIGGINIEDIGRYIIPICKKNIVKKLGKYKNRFYGNPLISTSRLNKTAIQYADYSDVDLLKPNFRNRTNPKHKCIGMIEVFVLHKDKLEELKNKCLAFDIEKMRKDGIFKPKREGIERANQEIVFSGYIDKSNYAGSIPLIYPRLNFGDNIREQIYGINNINAKQLPRKENFSKNAKIKKDLLEYVSQRSDKLANAYIYSLSQKH